MARSAFEQAAVNALRVLAVFLPGKSYLYVPLLYAAVGWAVNRDRVWKENILGWQIWPDPDYIRTKSDKFVREFFRTREELAQAYQQELRENDRPRLRAAFSVLYPILGLQDPFLAALFSEELQAGDFSRIERDFETRIRQAKEDIEAVEDRPRLLAGLKTFAEEILSLGSDFLKRSDIQRALQKIVEEEVIGSDD